MAGFSLLNGLSEAGKSVAAFAGTSALDIQKSDLQRQSLMLADQLATNRELNVTQPFQASQEDKRLQNLRDLQTGQQTFTGGENEKQRQNAILLENTRLSSQSAEAQKTRDAQVALEKLKLSQPPETFRMLQFLAPEQFGSPGSSPSGPSSGLATGAVDAGTWDNAASPTTAGAGSAASSAAPANVTGSAASGTPPVLSASALDNPVTGQIIRKLLGEPVPGSDDAIRRAIANGVATDPEWKDKPKDQQALETESRYAVATGKMTDPASRHDMAAAIASYQVAPLTNYALTKPGGPETMAEALRINPEYQETRYPEVADAMKRFGGGPEGKTIRSVNNAVQHLDVMDRAVDALGNKDMNAFNTIVNAAKKQFGVSAPNTFDGLKQIVGTEIEKAVAGGIGAESDRKRIMDSLSNANSPAQLKDMLEGFRTLMAGQVMGLKQQYEDATDFKPGSRFAFEKKLLPATIKALRLNEASDPPALAPVSGTVDDTSGVRTPSYPALPPGNWRPLQ